MGMKLSICGKDGNGYLFIDLFGGKTFVQGQLVRMDFVDENAIVLKPPL